MNNLSEIINDAKSGKKPTHEECYWAMLVLESLLTFNNSDFRKMINKPKFYTPERAYENIWGRNKSAYLADPKKYLGEKYNPSNPEYQKHREISEKLYEKFCLKGNV